MMKKQGLKLYNLVKKLALRVTCGEEQLDKEITGGYVSDLLSDVMANTKKGDVWITLQCHPNIVAVAVLKEICGIIIVNNRIPEQETIKKAGTENLPIMTTDLPAFEITGRLYSMGISGERK